eukprot:3235022-Amphidinium_carterae.1
MCWKSSRTCGSNGLSCCRMFAMLGWFQLPCLAEFRHAALQRLQGPAAKRGGIAVSARGLYGSIGGLLARFNPEVQAVD